MLDNKINGMVLKENHISRDIRDLPFETALNLYTRKIRAEAENDIRTLTFFAAEHPELFDKQVLSQFEENANILARHLILKEQMNKVVRINFQKKST